MQIVRVYGEIGLSVEIGPNSEVVNFLVVDNIVDKLIFDSDQFKTESSGSFFYLKHQLSLIHI